jgi:hypothetical protein
MKLRGILGLTTGVLLVLSSLAHAFLGLPPLRAELGAAGVSADASGAIAIGWYFGSVAMAAFGLIVLTSAINVLNGKLGGLRAVQWIALAYFLFGVAAFVADRLNPHFVGFIVIGVLLGVFARPVRAT